MFVEFGVTGKLSRDDDRKYRLSGALKVKVGAGIDLGVWRAEGGISGTISKTWAFNDYAALERWVRYQVSVIRQALAKYNLAKGNPVSDADRRLAKAKMQADRNVTAASKKGAVELDVGGNDEASAWKQSAGLSASISKTHTTFHRKNKSGVDQMKRGSEFRVDVELNLPPLKVSGFYQDMKNHANGDMDGRYLNLNIGRASTRKVGGDKPMNAIEMKALLASVKGKLQRLKGTATSAPAAVGRIVKGELAGKGMGGYGIELEWVCDPKGMALRFGRLFVETGASGTVGGPGAKASANASARKVITEASSAKMFNRSQWSYAVGQSRRGKKDSAQVMMERWMEQLMWKVRDAKLGHTEITTMTK